MVAPVTDFLPPKPALPNPARLPARFQEMVDYLEQLNAAIVRELDRRIPKSQPVEDLLLRSPGGKIYRVVVADNGVLSTVLVYG